jgi:putative addiction module component (TIGR02574 family)
MNIPDYCKQLFKEDFIMGIDQIASDALRLSASDRAILAEAIWESLEEPYIASSDMSEKKALALAKQRDKEIEQGKVEPLPHKELMARLRK